MPDLDARLAQVSGKASAAVAPRATHWVTRWFVLRDPDDNLIACAQPLPGWARERADGAR